ncbi:MAG: glycosyltransferase [Planctomycetota bacterium]
MWWLAVAYFVVQTLTVAYLMAMSVHQLWLTLQYRRHRGPDPEPSGRWRDDELPFVTVQLPVYNEGRLGEQVLGHAAALDYPRDRLEIQFLDDSTDGVSSEIALAKIEALRAEQPDLDVAYLRRTNRHHYKAGSLASGCAVAKGEFLAVFDADFEIPSDFLRRTVHHFRDPEVGMVQARWAYHNRFASFFTRLQAEKLDAHQMFDQTARMKVGLLPFFHGTAGLWRAKTIEDAGGWVGTCESEDVWLTIQASVRGWRFVYLDHLRVRSELPEDMLSFMVQRMRWKRGWTQIASALSGKMMGARSVSAWHRVDLLMRAHTTWGHVVALVMTLGVLPYFLAAAWLRLVVPAALLYLSLMALNLVMRAVEGRTLAEDAATPRSPKLLRWPLSWVPLGYLLDVGMAWAMTQATFESFRSGGQWPVTPKKGSGVAAEKRPRKKLPRWVVGTIGMGVASLALGGVSLWVLHPLAAAFYVAQSAGSLWVGMACWRDLRALNRPGGVEGAEREGVEDRGGPADASGGLRPGLAAASASGV